MFLFLNRQAHPNLSSIYGESPNIIKFFFQYWNTLPFGVGIVAFYSVVRLLNISRKQLPYAFAGVIVIPFLLFLIYWGSSSSGLLREGLHVWVLSLVVFMTLALKQVLQETNRFWKLCQFTLAIRGVEILVMLLIPTWFSVFSVINQRFLISDLVMLTTIISGVGLLSFHLYSYFHELWLDYNTSTSNQGRRILKFDES